MSLKNKAIGELVSPRELIRFRDTSTGEPVILKTSTLYIVLDVRKQDTSSPDPSGRKLPNQYVLLLGDLQTLEPICWIRADRVRLHK